MGHAAVLQSCLAWRDSMEGGGGGGGGSYGVCVCWGGGSYWWWMTSPLRETFPQPEHKEGRQKVKRMRKNRNLTQCVKKEAKCGRTVSG